MAQAERKFGSIPDWAKRGPIDRKNFVYRAELHCSVKSEERKGAHPTICKRMPEFAAWKAYFEWLGGYSWVFQMILDDENPDREYTVPELQPEWFDASYSPQRVR